ncbi:iron uptake system protein EfeO [Marisediminicola senii]|uniref:iron uptake system protein EfeO n=1 Tax=Marisediminicola senii TaxID=2711233 RepID=UPI0013ED4D50|nr:iron uptake system protein EfeO [Marisediminicola senii]
MTAPTIRFGLSALTAIAVAVALAGCVANSQRADAAALSVESTADDCVLSSTSAPSGTVAFDVTNSTDIATEFYLLADDGLRIVGEVENIAPGAPRTLTLALQPGEYFTVCKPGMIGDGVGRAAFTVTDSGSTVEPTGDEAQRLDAAAANYVAYVKDQVAQLVPATRAFLDAYRAGDDDTARSLYATSRAYYERIEPVAESFGDLDPSIDFREADVAEGDEWTGWHRIEKDLWPPADSGYVALTADERSYFSDLLTTDTQALFDAVYATDYSVTIDAISNGAIGLLDEVASGKITGEEEIWSHTDLWDFQGNLEGARVAYEGVRDIVEPGDPELVGTLDAEFAELEAQLATFGSLESGFTYYDDLTTDQVKGLADGVNALAEPLSRLTAALVD